jgi:hypothetical protein
MSDSIASLLDDALPPLPHAEPDWQDVRRRARPGGHRLPIVARTLAVALVALVVAAAALASSGGLRSLVGLGHRSAITLTASFGDAGSVQLDARGLYVGHRHAIVVGRLRPVGARRRFPRTVAVHWRIGVPNARTRITLELRGRTVATLCSPCTDGAHGTLALRPRVVMALFGGRGVAVRTHPHAVAPLRLRPPG